MRSGRRIFRVGTPEFSFSDLSVAFDLSGIPVLPPEWEFGTGAAFNSTRYATMRSNTGRAVFASIHFDAGAQSPSSSERYDDVSYRYFNKWVPARAQAVVQSRHHNVRLDRPKNSACYRPLGCPPSSPQKAVINVNKQEDNPLNFCGETAVLQRFIVGLSPRLLAARREFERAWVGDKARLAALLDYRSRFAPEIVAAKEASSTSTSSGGNSGSDDRSSTSPTPPPQQRAIFDLAVHCRISFLFVEKGFSEEENRNADEVRRWMAKPATKSALAALAADVRQNCEAAVFAPHRHRHRQEEEEEEEQQQQLSGATEATTDSSEGSAPPVCAVYIASETAIVRRHLAEVIARSSAGEGSSTGGGEGGAEGEGGGGGVIEADFSSFAGHAHPVDLHNDHRVIGAGAPWKERLAALTPKETADLCAPYLEWWALAHSRTILVRRGEALSAASSTFSGTAHLYGGWE